MIKSITESKRLGWEWDTDLIEVADNLYNQQIPKSWCLLSGSRTTFSFYPLGSFFNDLIVRFQHVDKCLTLVINLFLIINKVKQRYVNSLFVFKGARKNTGV